MIVGAPTEAKYGGNGEKKDDEGVAKFPPKQQKRGQNDAQREKIEEQRAIERVPVFDDLRSPREKQAAQRQPESFAVPAAAVEPPARILRFRECPERIGG